MTAPRHILSPQPGYWMIRLRRGAIETPACIRYEQTTVEPGTDNRMDRSPILTARIRDEIVPWERVWHVRGRPIDEAEFNFRVAESVWARQHAPELPYADPYRPIDLAAMPPVYQRKT